MGIAAVAGLVLGLLSLRTNNNHVHGGATDRLAWLLVGASLLLALLNAGAVPGEQPSTHLNSPASSPTDTPNNSPAPNFERLPPAYRN